MTPEELAEKAVPCQPHSGRVMTFAHVVRQEVAAAIRAAVAEERERCRRVALCWAGRPDVLGWNGREVAEFIARDLAFPNTPTELDLHRARQCKPGCDFCTSSKD